MNLMKAMIPVFFSLSLMLQGCVLLAVGAGAAAGVGTVAYIKGELQTTYAASLDETWDASLEALKELNLRIVSTRKGEAEGEIEAKKVGEDKVSVALSIAGPGTTLVKIRVGIFGDERESRAISKGIESKLRGK